MRDEISPDSSFILPPSSLPFHALGPTRTGDLYLRRVVFSPLNYEGTARQSRNQMARETRALHRVGRICVVRQDSEAQSYKG